jgi:hypothetical protein
VAVEQVQVISAGDGRRNQGEGGESRQPLPPPVVVAQHPQEAE